MASIQKRNSGWRTVIRRRGRPTLIKFFPTKREAEVWGRHIESQFDKGIVEDLRAARKTTLAELFERYALETAGVKKNASRERHILALLTRHFGRIALADLTTKDVAEFRNMRLQVGRSAATVNNNIHLLSAVIEKAMGEWGYWLPFNPARRVKKPKAHNMRDRRLVGNEEARLLAAAERVGGRQLQALIILALESAMRLSEMLTLRRHQIDCQRRCILLTDTKNGEIRRVPLSLRAIAALQMLESSNRDRPFSNWKAADSFNKCWHRLLKLAEIRDLRFHDLRHEAASRLSERGMNAMKIAAITGHKSLQMLRRYTHFRVEDLAAELDLPADERPQPTRPLRLT